MDKIAEGLMKDGWWITFATADGVECCLILELRSQ